MNDDLPDVTTSDELTTDDSDETSLAKWGVGAAAIVVGVVVGGWILVPLLFGAVALLVKLAIIGGVAYGAYRIGSAMLEDDDPEPQRTLPEDVERDLLEDKSAEEVADMELEREFEELERELENE